MTFLSLYISRWWRHAWDTYLYVTLGNQSAARISTEREINYLTYWGRVTHICVGNLAIIGSDNGFSPGLRQAIIWTNDGMLLIGPLGTNFSEISIEIQTFSFKIMRLKVSSAKRRPFCLGLNVLMECILTCIQRLPWLLIDSHRGKFALSQHCTLYPLAHQANIDYRKISNISRTNSPNVNVSRLDLQLSLPNPMKLGVRSRMKM